MQSLKNEAAPILRAPRPEIPKFPGGIPYFGHVTRARNDAIGLFVDALAMHPNAVRFTFGPHAFVLVNSPDAIKHVLTDNAKAYHKSRDYDGLKILLGQGLLTSEGDVWKRQRKLAQPAFHRQKIAALTRAMASETRRMLDRWSSSPVEAMNVHAEMMRVTFAIVGRTLFSTDVDGSASVIGSALAVAIEWTTHYAETFVRLPRWLPTPSNRAFDRALRTLDGLVEKLIEDRRAHADPGDDLLGMLMAATDETGRERMDARQLRDEALTIVLAGHETTANLLSFVFHLLATNPEWDAIVAREVAEVLGGRDPGFDDVPKLERTRAVIDEALRLYPPAWAFERVALEDDEINEGRLPKGTNILVSPFVLHRTEALFPSPETFDPRRFLPGAPERHKYAYLPFGGGPRTCIGNVFALTEATIALAMIAREYRPIPKPGKTLALDPKITLRPVDDVPVMFVRRTA